jgi:hypothetical protein
MTPAREQDADRRRATGNEHRDDEREKPNDTM